LILILVQASGEKASRLRPRETGNNPAPPSATPGSRSRPVYGLMSRTEAPSSTTAFPDRADPVASWLPFTQSPLRGQLRNRPDMDNRRLPDSRFIPAIEGAGTPGANRHRSSAPRGRQFRFARHPWTRCQGPIAVSVRKARAPAVV